MIVDEWKNTNKQINTRWNDIIRVHTSLSWLCPCGRRSWKVRKPRRMTVLTALPCLLWNSLVVSSTDEYIREPKKNITVVSYCLNCHRSVLASPERLDFAAHAVRTHYTAVHSDPRFNAVVKAAIHHIRRLTTRDWLLFACHRPSRLRLRTVYTTGRPRRVIRHWMIVYVRSCCVDATLLGATLMYYTGRQLNKTRK